MKVQKNFVVERYVEGELLATQIELKKLGMTITQSDLLNLIIANSLVRASKEGIESWAAEVIQTQDMQTLAEKWTTKQAFTRQK